MRRVVTILIPRIDHWMKAPERHVHMNEGDILYLSHYILTCWACAIITITVIIDIILLVYNHIAGPLMLYIRQSIVTYCGHSKIRQVLTLHNRVAVHQSTDKYKQRWLIDWSSIISYNINVIMRFTADKCYYNYSGFKSLGVNNIPCQEFVVIRPNYIPLSVLSIPPCIGDHICE